MTGAQLKALVAKIPDTHRLDFQVSFQERGHTIITLMSSSWPFENIPPGGLPETATDQLRDAPNPKSLPPR